MSVRHQTNDEAGFALIDLLVAIAVTGLAGSVLVGLVAFVEHIRAETWRRDSEREGALVLERMVRLLIDNAPPFVVGTSSSSAIVGDKHAVALTSNGLPVISLPQAATFRLHRGAGTADKDVVLSWVDDAGQRQRAVLAHGVSELTFAYLPLGAASSKSRDSRQGAWRSQWRAEDGPLSALRMGVQFGPASPLRVFVIPIQADLPASCLRNPRQARCDRGSFSQ